MPDEKTPFITARVIGESSRPFVRTMILNAGTANQVRKGQAVVDERGLLGRIYVSGENTSWVILLTDLNSRVPVVIEPSHRRAILAGDNTPAPQLELDVGEGPIRSGDRVLSTGDGGLLPPDLPVGVVTGNGANARVVLFATAASADAVNILDYRVPEPPAPADPATAVPAKTSSSATSPAVAAVPPDSRRITAGGAGSVTERCPALFLLLAAPSRLFGRLIPNSRRPRAGGGRQSADFIYRRFACRPRRSRLAAICYWALARPSLMPPYAVLLIGLVEDLLSGGPPGLWATGFLAGYVLIDRQRKTLLEVNGAGNVVAFTGVMVVAAAGAYAVASAIYLRLLPIAPLLLESIITVILYPLLQPVLHFADRNITRLVRSAG